MAIVREIDLYLNAGQTAPRLIHVNQYDSGERWLFNLYEESGTRYIPSSGAIVGLKSDKHGILNTGSVNESGQVVINETKQMTAAPGKAVFELMIDGGTHGTANFHVIVEPRPGDNADMSESDMSMIQTAVENISTAIEAAQTAAQKASEAASSASTAVSSASTASVSKTAAQAAQTAAESAKSSAQASATSASNSATAAAQSAAKAADDVSAIINSDVQNKVNQAVQAASDAVSAQTSAVASADVAKQANADAQTAKADAVTAAETAKKYADGTASNVNTGNMTAYIASDGLLHFKARLEA